MRRFAVAAGITILLLCLVLPAGALAQDIKDVAITAATAATTQRGDDIKLEVTIMAMKDISSAVVTIKRDSLPQQLTLKQASAETTDIKAKTWRKVTIPVGTGKDTPEGAYKIQYGIELVSGGKKYTGSGHASATVKSLVLKSPCFIATACYGSPLAAEIDALREFRDMVLMEDICGRAFVDLYYSASPPVADLIAQHQALRFIVRYGLVEPAVNLVVFTKPAWCR